MQQPWCPPLIHPLGTGKHPVVNLSGATGDTVHLAPAAYRDTATAILEAGVEIDDDVVSCVAFSSDGSFKRKRLDSMVTWPSENEKKRSRGADAQAGWLTGRQNHMAAAATVRGHQASWRPARS